MRKISNEAVYAFLHAIPYKKSNTKIVVTNDDPKHVDIFMYLFDNMIAHRIVSKFSERIEISNAGWKSNTTKERLNAIPGVSITQRNWQWYLNGKEWNGDFISI